jgi:hypothetical protein
MTSSTSFIAGTGERKCIPITRPGFAIEAASWAIGIDEVFEAITVSALTVRRRVENPVPRGLRALIVHFAKHD